MNAISLLLVSQGCDSNKRQFIVFVSSLLASSSGYLHAAGERRDVGERDADAGQEPVGRDHRDEGRVDAPVGQRNAQAARRKEGFTTEPSEVHILVH